MTQDLGPERLPVSLIPLWLCCTRTRMATRVGFFSTPILMSFFMAPISEPRANKTEVRGAVAIMQAHASQLLVGSHLHGGLMLTHIYWFFS